MYVVQCVLIKLLSVCYVVDRITCCTSINVKTNTQLLNNRSRHTGVECLTIVCAIPYNSTD